MTAPSIGIPVCINEHRQVRAFSSTAHASKPDGVAMLYAQIANLIFEYEAYCELRDGYVHEKVADFLKSKGLA